MHGQPASQRELNPLIKKRGQAIFVPYRLKPFTNCFMIKRDESRFVPPGMRAPTSFSSAMEFTKFE
jgi:hypothetical protein